MLRSLRMMKLILILLLAASTWAQSTYRVQFETTAGNFTFEVHRDWAPQGADRFRELVASNILTTPDSSASSLAAGRSSASPAIRKSPKLGEPAPFLTTR